jgi:hypothetical protein
MFLLEWLPTLLLSAFKFARSGAVGINLTQANRVFLLEPAMNPSLEAQAIGRVHRLGQTRNVEIVRLLMKDSIDTRITQLVDKKHSRAPTCGIKVGQYNNDVAASAVAIANAPIVGSMRTDKAGIMAEEFDFLFRLTTPLDNYKFWGAAPFTEEDDSVNSDDSSFMANDDGIYIDDDDDANDDHPCVPDCVKSEL